MRVVAPIVAPMPSLSWPQHSSGLILSGLLATSEPLTDPVSSRPTHKGCKAYEHGWSKRDEGSSSLLRAGHQPLMAAREQCGGIEKLVDELCAKLKQIQDGDTEAPQTPRPNFATLVLQDMHDSQYCGYPSLGVEYADNTWPDECYFSDTWTNNNNKSQYTKDGSIYGGDTQPASFYQDRDGEYLRVLAENKQNSLYNEDEDLDLYIDPSSVKEDSSLARLIAKFDSTVEALWSPDSMVLEDKSPQQVEAHTSFLSSGTNLTSSIWSDTSLEPRLEDKVVGERKVWGEEPVVQSSWPENPPEEKSWTIGYGLGILSQQLLDDENETQQNSLNLINHHREKSGFSEVQRGKKNSGMEKISNAIAIERPMTTQEEEDLLTSAKTHFRPIKQNSVESNSSTSQETVRYEDGMTFSISSSLDKPPFTRSSSGTLYLNSISTSPRKYMLYTEKEPFNGKYNTGGFIPKFAVKKSEKCIQVDFDGDESDIDEDKGFYFPEDEGNFADNIDCPADIEDEGDSDSDNDTGEPEFCVEHWKEKAWSTACEDNSKSVPTWSDAKWCGESFHHLWHESSTEASKPSAQLREELSAEGEQLFADIQYLQQLILGDCWQPSQEEDEHNTEDVVVTEGCSPWRHTERTYDDINATPRNMHTRNAGISSLSIWECAGPPPPCPKSGM